MSEDDKEEIRKIIKEEIIKHFEVDFRNTGYETMGLEIKISYDTHQLEYGEL